MTGREAFVGCERLIKDYGGAQRAARTASGPSTASASPSSAGTTLGLVGESGSGKSTVGRLLLRLERPTAGEVTFDGIALAASSGRALRSYRRRVQVCCRIRMPR